jgi:hypothetical protein
MFCSASDAEKERSASRYNLSPKKSAKEPSKDPAKAPQKAPARARSRLEKRPRQTQKSRTRGGSSLRKAVRGRRSAVVRMPAAGPGVSFAYFSPAVPRSPFPPQSPPACWTVLSETLETGPRAGPWRPRNAALLDDPPPDGDSGLETARRDCPLRGPLKGPREGPRGGLARRSRLAASPAPARRP